MLAEQSRAAEEERRRLQVPLIESLRYQSMSSLGVLRGSCDGDKSVGSPLYVLTPAVIE